MEQESEVDPVDALRDKVGPVRDAGDALHFLAALSRSLGAGDALMVILDEERRLLDMWAIVDGAEHLELLVQLAGCYAEACHFFLAVDRTGKIPADRPDDELTWLELKDLAATKGLCLCDLFVVWGTKAFSVAEFSPAPAQW